MKERFWRLSVTCSRKRSVEVLAEEDFRIPKMMHRPLGRVAFSGGVKIVSGAPPGRSGFWVLTLLGHAPQTKGVVKRQSEHREREVTDCRLETT